MSESMAAQDTEQMGHGASAAAAGMSAGVLLRQLRESAGVHIDMLAGALKVPVAKLQALEEDRYEAFPDAVFMRGLASSMCRALKVDAAPVLALLPQGAPIHLPPDKGINTAFKDSGRRLGKGGGGTMEQPKSRLVGIAVVVLLLAALAVAFVPMGNDGEEGAAAVPAPAQANPAAQEAPDTLAAPRAAPQAEPVAQPAQTASTPAVLEHAVAGSTPAAAAPQDVLVIRARAQTWVQVRDAAGRVVLQKALAVGESYTAEGSAPWNVVVGKADATEVIVRGQPMDLKAIARENVARFEVK